MRLSTIPARLELAGALDVPAGWLRKLAGQVPAGPVRDTLHGVPAGHPMHPALVQVPVGAFVCATTLDFVPRTGPASAILITVGLGAAVPAALAGAVDLADTHKQQQRVGVVHAVCNSTALSLYAMSLVARMRHRPVRARACGLAGLVALAAGGFLGGHLAYRQATGANHAEHVPHTLGDDEWHSVGRLSELAEGKPVHRIVGDDTSLVVVRRGTGVDVLAGRCSHLSGPLWEGEIDDGCVTCPWHGSVFRLDDGSVVNGPATAPQPVFETRFEGDEVLVRLPGAG